jgi:hypothetical protein
MKINSKTIQMTDMQWPEIMMECIIEKSFIDAEVVGRDSGFVRDERGSIDSSG